jgi:hypothetical protein
MVDKINYQLRLRLDGLNNEAQTLFEVLCNDSPIGYDPISILTSIKIDKYPDFLQNMTQEKDYSGMEYSWILFGEVRNDENEIFVPKNKVGFAIFEDITLIDKKDFFGICLNFAEKAIEAVDLLKLKEKQFVDNCWIEKIKDLIPLIKNKIVVQNEL